MARSKDTDTDVNVGRLTTTKFENESNIQQFHKLLRMLDVEESEFKYWDEVIMKPQQTKSKGEPGEKINFRLHPNAIRIVQQIIEEMPKGMGFTFSDAGRSGIMMWAQKALAFIKNPSKKKEHLETLKCLNELSYLLDDVALKEDNRKRKNITKNIDAFNDKMVTRTTRVLDEIEAKLLSFRPTEED